MAQLQSTTLEDSGLDLDRPVPVVSSDAHVGPRLMQDLRPYCPQKYLEAFDAFGVQLKAEREEMMKRRNPFTEQRSQAEAKRMMDMFASINSTTGHYDPQQRLREMDKDGVTAEVQFPTTHNGEPQPFIQSDLHLDPSNGDKGLFAVGQRIYAEWLADWCKTSPSRLHGLVTPPLWDVAASVETAQWAAKAGLRGIYLLSPRAGIKRYDHPDWEPFWAACADLGMNMCTHSGAPMAVEGRNAIAMREIEIGGWPMRAAAHQLLFAGVFERYPKLKIAFTEQNFDWWTTSMREWDSVWANHGSQLQPIITRKPSEYAKTNLFIGASFLAPFEAQDAVRCGYTANVMWGRDYGHIEGTFQVTEDDEPATNPGRLSMRYALAEVPPADALRMVSANAIDFFGLDRKEQTAIAESFRYPVTLRELSSPIDGIPANGGALAFRQVGAWG